MRLLVGKRPCSFKKRHISLRLVRFRWALRPEAYDIVAETDAGPRQSAIVGGCPARSSAGRRTRLHPGLHRRTGDCAAALVLEGEAGIGKSTLWLAGVEHARALGLRVLSSRPAEAERGLAHVGLGDLFEDVLDEVLPALVARRGGARSRSRSCSRRRAARRRGSAGARHRDAQRLAAARRRQPPLLVAIDDLQWLDASSASALAFALRRLGVERRAPAARPAARRRRAAVGISSKRSARSASERLAVGPLSVGALHRLLRDRLGRPFARQTLLRIHEQSGGNPFFALELARVLDADVDPLSRSPVPETLEELVRAQDLRAPRVHARGARARLGARHDARSRCWSGPALPRTRSTPAVAANVIERDDGHDSLHPPAAVVGPLPGPGRGAARAFTRASRASSTIRFSAPVTSRSRRTRRTPTSPRVLDDAATPRRRSRRVGRRGRARRAGAPADAARRGATSAIAARSLQLVRITLPGEWTRARTIAADLLAEAEIGSLRAEALILLAELESVDRARRAARGGPARGGSRPALQSVIHCRLAWATRFRKGYVRALEHARAAFELADELDDDVLRARAQAVQAILGWIVGDAEAPPLPARAARLRDGGRRRAAGAGGDVRRRQHARAARRGETRPAPCSSASTEEWRERDEPRSARALWGLSWVEFWGGRWELAAELRRARRTTSRSSTGSRCRRTTCRSRSSPSTAGELELAREHSERALELAGAAVRAPSAAAPGDPRARRAVERRRGRRRVEWLEQGGRGRPPTLGWGEPSIRWWTRRLRRGAARARPRSTTRCELLDVWEADAARLGRDWVLAHVTRCRGLARRRRRERRSGRRRSCEQAVAQHEAVGDPYGRARALLALGIVRRRDRQKRAAREALAGGARRLRAARRGHLGREGARRARKHRRAHARGRADGGRAPRRRPRRRGPHEPRGRRRALPRRADGGEPSDAHLRQARRALAHRARPPAAMTNRRPAKFRRSDVSTASPAP